MWEIILNALKWIHKVKKKIQCHCDLWQSVIRTELMDVNVLRWFFGAGRFWFFFVLFFCDSDCCYFKINGERIEKLLLWERHSLNQAGFVEVNRQWPGSIIHSVITLMWTWKAKSQQLEKQSIHSRINEQESSVRGASGGSRLAPRPCWHCPQSWAAWGTGCTACQQNSRDCVQSLPLKMLFLHCQLGFGVPSSCQKAAVLTLRWAWSSAGTCDFLSNCPVWSFHLQKRFIWQVLNFMWFPWILLQKLSHFLSPCSQAPFQRKRKGI